MPNLTGFVRPAVLSAVLLLVLCATGALAASGDTIADRVFGQNGSLMQGACGAISAATLCDPGSIALDGSGHLYITDPGANRVLEYDTPLTSSNPSRVFGQGASFTTSACNSGGISADSLCTPQGVAVDGAGRLYIADAANNRVLEFDSPLASQTANRVFGQGGSFTSSVPNNGGLSASSLAFPRSPMIDGAGHLYVVDNNNRVLEYDTPLASQTANRIFGQDGSFASNTCNNGGLSASSLCQPGGMASDSAGHLYIADSLNYRVLEYDSPLTNQTANRVFGQGGSFTSNACNNGGRGAGSLCVPLGLVVGAGGYLYVADTGNNRVLEYDTPLVSQTANRVFGQNGDFTTNWCNLGGISANSLCSPYAVAVDAIANLYVADTQNARALRFNSPLTTDTIADYVFGKNGDLTQGGPCALNTPTDAATLCEPLGLAADGSGRLYVADTNNHRVMEYDSPLTSQAPNRVFGQVGDFTANACNNGGIGANTLCGPQGSFADSGGHLYVADAGNNRVLEYDSPLSSQTANRVFGQGGSFTSSAFNNGGISASSLWAPTGAAADTLGHLYIADAANNRVLEYDSPLTSQTANRVFGQRGSFTSNACNNGGISADSLCYPRGLFVDAAGRLYIVDYDNNRVLEYDTPLASQTANRVFGSFTNSACDVISASSACGPNGVAGDSAGRLYIADSNNRVLEYDSPLTSQTANRVFGQGGSFTSNACNNGGISPSSLCYPFAVAVDRTNNLYVSDVLNRRILEYDQPAVLVTSVGGVAEQPDVRALPSGTTAASNYHHMASALGGGSAALLVLVAVASWRRARRRHASG